MNANWEWVEAGEISGLEGAPFGVGKADFLNSIPTPSSRVHSRF